MLRLRIFTVLFLLAPSSLSALSIAKTRDKQDYSSSSDQLSKLRAACASQTSSAQTYQQATQYAVKQEQKAVAVAVAPQQAKAAAPAEVQQAQLQAQSSSPTLDTSSDSDRYVQNAQKAYWLNKDIETESKQLASLKTLQTRQSSLTEQVQLINEVIPHTTYSQENVQQDTRIALLAQYELQKKASHYQDQKNALAHAAQNPNNDNCDLLHDHLQYVKNEAHHAKTQIALQGVGSIIQENKGQIRTSRSAKGALYAHQKSSAQAIRNTRLEDHERAAQLYQDLEKARSQKAELQERLSSWRYKLNIWAEPEKELTKKMQDHDRTITAQTQQLQDILERDLALQELVEKRQKEEDERNPFPQLPPSSPDPESPRGSQSFSLARAATVVHQASLATGGLLLCYECYAKLKSLHIPDDHPLIKVFKSLQNWLKNIYPFYKDAHVLKVADFSSLTRYAYELAYQKQQCLALQKELEELEKEYQRTKDTDLLPDHWKYIQNEEKLTAIEKGLTETHQLLEKFSATLSDAPEYKDIQDKAGNTHDLAELFHNAQMEAYKNFAALQKLEEEHQRLNKSWGISTEERQKLEKSYQDHVAGLTKDFDSALRQSLIAEKFLRDQAQHKDTEKVLAGTTFALFAADQLLKNHRPLSLSDVVIAGAFQAHSTQGMCYIPEPGMWRAFFTAVTELPVIKEVAIKGAQVGAIIIGGLTWNNKKTDDPYKSLTPPQQNSQPSTSSKRAEILQKDVLYKIGNRGGLSYAMTECLTLKGSIQNRKKPNPIAILPKALIYGSCYESDDRAELERWNDPKNDSIREACENAALIESKLITDKIAKDFRCSPEDLRGTTYDLYSQVKNIVDRNKILKIQSSEPASPPANSQKPVENKDVNNINSLQCNIDANTSQQKPPLELSENQPAAAEGQKTPKVKIGDGETTDEADGKIKAAEQEGQEDAKKGNQTPDITIEDIISRPNVKPGRATKGKTKQYETPGTFEDAEKDFEDLKPKNVVLLSDGKGKRGVLSDGREVIVRPQCSGDESKPTLEVQNGKKFIKVRYG